MPVLQGYSPESYAAHVDQYAELFTPGQWVGVGSVCKRNGNPDQIEDILLAIKAERPDLQLHGFGITLSRVPPFASYSTAPNFSNTLSDAGQF
jgi:hypothetical protein